MSLDAAENQKLIFARNLVSTLDAKDLTQDDLARALGCSSSTVSDWCNAKKYPRVNRMQQIADYLNVSMHELREPPGQILFKNKSEYDRYFFAFKHAIGNRIQERMTELGIDESKMMRDLRIGNHTYERIVSGNIASLQSDMLDRLSEELETTSKYLLMGTDDPYDYDRDPKKLLAEIPDTVFPMLYEANKGDREAVWKEWYCVDETYRIMMINNPELYFKKREKIRGKIDFKRTIQGRQIGTQVESESLHLLEPTAKRLDKLSAEERNDLIKIFAEIVDAFTKQIEDR